MKNVNRKIIIIPAIAMLLIVLLLRVYSFDGRFNSIERGLMNRDILKYKIYGGDRFSNQLTINIYTDSINFQGIHSRHSTQKAIFKKSYARNC